MSAWQPIETAPKDGTRILLAGAQTQNYSNCIVIGRWLARSDNLQRWGDTDSKAPVGEPTHWMPLPKAPK